MKNYSVENRLSAEVNTLEEDHADVEPGALDGLTIMRHAPFYRERSNGGVEQCLRALNRGLLERHRLTILQVYRVSDLKGTHVEAEHLGLGRILWTPVAYRRTKSRYADIPQRARFIFNQTKNSGSNRSSSSPAEANAGMILSQQIKHLRHRSVVLSDPLARLLTAQHVDLLAVHGLTYDAGALIQQAKKSTIPFVLINHFHNFLFSEPGVRSWIPCAAGIGAVSWRDMPHTLRTRCVRLLDAIDTDFFSPREVLTAKPSNQPVILLPALIKPGKGHEDLLQASRILDSKGLAFTVCFAGFAESESLHQTLRAQAATIGRGDRVVFLGELSQEKMRDHYSFSNIVALPTYSEGLPRTLIEAQAMEKPVVAYDSGGVSETMLEGKTGVLVKTGNVKQLANALEELLLSEQKQRRMGEQGRQFVIQNFSIPSLIRRHESFYLHSIARKPPSEF